VTRPARGSQLRALRELARQCRIQTAYLDPHRHRVEAPPETLLATLRALGVEVADLDAVPSALEAARFEFWRSVIEPVTVAAEGRLTRLRLRVPESTRRGGGRPLRLRLLPEGGAEQDVGRAWRVDVAPTVLRREEVGGRAFVELEVPVRGAVPIGYHDLHVSFMGREGSTFLVAAPRRAAAVEHEATWGAFIPLFALRSERSWGVGDLTDLQALMTWVAGLGGGVVATLPMLATFLGDRPYDHSPYSPASKLFWNELHLDVTRVPELERSPEARAVLASQSLRDEVDALRAAPLVDYRRAMAAKRGVLQALERAFFADPGPRERDLRAFVRANPRVTDYAAFRANCERWNDPWQTWPRRERKGAIPKHGGNPDAYRYHLYAQWQMAEQMHRVDATAKELGTGLYFDAPIGVNPDSYDVWRERDAFAMGVSAGAPPDLFFTGGQDWGFPPLHPERIRRQRYAYPIAGLRHLFRHADVLRIDHVMGLHRLYWVPHGADATHGVYVRYRPEEWYAILAVESRRNDTVIVGEDLGVVPAEVRPALRRHAVYRSHVVQMELAERPDGPLDLPPRDGLASLNTHDMPPFAGFWDGVDIDIRLERGWLDPGRLDEERDTRRRQRATLVAALRRDGRLPPEDRAPSERAVLDACLRDLAASPARLVVVNLEDLWFEREPHNVPGTTTQYTNWRRVARYRLEEIRELRPVRQALRAVDRARRSAPPAASAH
jgi:4-alpha-glucanotransferase